TDGMPCAVKKSSGVTITSSGKTLMDAKTYFHVYSMTRKPKKRTRQLQRESISQRCMGTREYRVITEIHINGYGSIPVVKGDPRILPEEAQLFVFEKAKLMRPRAIYICDGSQLEVMNLKRKITQMGMGKALEALIDCHLVTTDTRDASTSLVQPSVCSDDRWPSGMWHLEGISFAKRISHCMMSLELDERFPASMSGRVMYVIPFSLGPIGAVDSFSGIQLTDSPYIALMTSICARVSASLWDCIEGDRFIRCIHSVGVQRPSYCSNNNNYPCSPEQQRFQVVYPKKREVWSYGIGSEDAVLCKNEVSLRLASVIAKEEGWLAERMTIIAISDSDKTEHFFGLAGPDGCGKSCMAFLRPTIPGWKVEVLGDEVAWIRVGSDRRLYASTPLNGFFLHISGFDPSKQCGSEFLSKNAIFTNVGYTSLGYPCWSTCNMRCNPGEVTYDWCGKSCSNNDERTIEHPQASVAVRCINCPTMHAQWESSNGVPLSAIIFCTRRHTGVPLISEAFTWQHGVFRASTIRADALNSKRGENQVEPIFDPMGMARFLGYSFGDYLKHWLSFDKSNNRLPKLFFINLFQSGSNNEYLWPGYGDNIRIFEWIIRRISSPSVSSVIDTPVGFVPAQESINLKGLCVKWNELIATPKEFWMNEMTAVRKIFDNILDTNLPKEICEEFSGTERRLSPG
uniref:phosphoenolpyruvate carboxykinase (GTP) n=3 Tax=Parascaris univalens TaxID=6257 RepID=A0A915C1P2_PARUN